MILRSQLRMNKNIVFPFISCIMIMFTLLVLIHKSADELNATKKELAHCKEQYESTASQLQNTIESKLRLEKSLENERSDSKQKIEKLQSLLDQEKEERRKDKEEASSNFDSLNERFNLIQTENKESNDQLEKSNKKTLELEEELSKLNSNLKEMNVESENKDKVINELRDQLKAAENASSVSLKKSTPSEDNGNAQNGQIKLAAVQNSVKGPSTPQINPVAVGHSEESPKQVIVPPNGDPENLIQKEMRDSLNMGVAEEVKPPQENVVKPPQTQADDDKNKQNIANRTNVNGEVQSIDRIQPNMFLPAPLNFDLPNKQPSSASNNAAENREVLPIPVQAPGNEKNNKKINWKKIKEDYESEVYDNIPEDAVEGEDEAYNDNDGKNKIKNKNQ